MASKFRTIVVVAFALVGAAVLIIVGYRVGWTGFTGKTLWDWLQLLIIPLVLAVGALLFNLATTRTEQKIASDKQREDLLTLKRQKAPAMPGLGMNGVRHSTRWP